MKTYQDFLEANTSPQRLVDFIRAAIAEHQSSEAYIEAQTARRYYNGENVTISNHKNLLYDKLGNKFEDIWTPNNKLTSNIFRNAVDQRQSFLLANGVSFNNDSTKDRLGTPQKPFDTQTMRAVTEAHIAGTVFTYFNMDHIEVFPFESFAPLYDVMDGGLGAGIRTWRLADDKPQVVFIFEKDGYSIFREDRNGELRIETPKRAYRLTRTASAVSEEIADGEPYPGFPIVPLSCNRQGFSLLHGNRATIDALDLCRSCNVNNADSNLIYFLFEGYEGMNDFDIVDALATLRRLHGMATPPTGEGNSISAHTVQPPFEGIQATIEEIKAQLESDLAIFNPQTIISHSDTATAIRAAYEPLNVATNIFEVQHLQPWVLKILELAGIKGEKATFARDTITNVQEQMQTLMMLAPYVDEQYVRETGMTYLGDIDKIKEVSARMEASAMERLGNAGEENEKIDDG